jgi:uncharacterized protein YndB with AHSA1/START domain
MPDIMRQVKIHASPERVYQAHTASEGVRNWTRDAVLDSKIGGTGEFGFPERRVVTKVRVAELKPPVRVGWKTIASNAPGRCGKARRSRSICELKGEPQLSRSRTAASQADDGYARVTNGLGSLPDQLADLSRDRNGHSAR